MRVSKLIFGVVAMAAFSPALAGDIKGAVKFSGAAPKLEPLKVSKDQGVCGATMEDESVMVANGALKNVIVMVKGVAGAKAEPKNIKVDQVKCKYLPHVQATGAGSTVDVINSDSVLHNVHAYLGTATTFNMAMPLKGQKIPKKMDKAGVVKLKCDVHPWMTGFIVVHDNPHYAVVGDDGSFSIKGVPAGTYQVTAWHEKLGEKTASVTVPATGDATADFTFGADKS